jgi:integrase
MSKRGENIWHRKDGRWEARYIKDRLNGRAVYGYVYAKTYKEVKEKQMSKAKEVDSITAPKCNIFINELFDLFLENKKHHVKASTYSKYSRDINNHLRPYWSHVHLNDVNSLMIENFINYLSNVENKNQNKKFSAKTIKDLIVLLKSIILYANQRELCSVNINSVAPPKQIKSRIQVLTKDDQQIFERFLYKDIDLTKMGILLTLYTGIRIGELCALQWKNIDMKNQVLNIEKTIQRISVDSTKQSTKIIFDTPKSNASTRSVPIFTNLFYILKNSFYNPNLSDNCFFLTGTTNYVEPRNFYRKYQNCIEKCGLHHYTFHCLRHTFATRAIECGIDPKSLSEILGHANVKITLDKYVHSDFEVKKAQMELFSKIVNF